MASFTDQISILIKASSSGAVQELENLQKEAKKSGDSFDTLGKKIGLTGAALKTGLAAGAAALMGGGLLSFLNSSVDAFVESQEAARQWASMTNSSIEQAGKFTTLVKGYGIELNDLVEINAEFAATIREQPQLLEELGVAVTKNKDGTIDMNKTLADSLDALQNVEDGVKQTAMAIDLLGEEGGKQLMPLIQAGKDIGEALERINFVDHSEEAREFKAATADLSLAFQELQTRVGAEIVPLLADLAGVATDVIGVLTKIPTEIYLVVGAFAAWKKLNVGAFLGQAFGNLGVPIRNFNLLTGEVEGATRAVDGLKASMKGLAASYGPLLLVTAAMEIFISQLTRAERVQEFIKNTDSAGKSLRDMAEELRNTDGVIDSLIEFFNTDLVGPNSDKTANKAQEIAINMETLAKQTLANADATDVAHQAAQRYLNVIGTGSDKQKAANAQTEEGTAAFQELQEALAGVGPVTQDAALAQTDLNTAIEQFVKEGGKGQTTWAQIQGLAKKTADNQAKLRDATYLTNVAMLQYGTAAERAAAGQEILNYMIEGGLSTGQQFQGMAMRTAEAQKEQEANTRLLNTELAKYGTNADRAATGQANLNAMIEDGVTSGADFEDVARRTAEAQYLQSVNTDLAEAALSKYHFTVGQVLDDLSDDTKWSTGIDSLKESLMGLDFKDDPLTKWLNEKDADAREAGQRIMAELKAALEVDPNIDPLVWLEDLKKNAPPEVRKVIEQIQQDLKDNPLDVPTKIEPPSLADLEAELAALQFAIDRNKFVGTGELDTTDMEKRAREIELTLGINLPVSVTGIEGPGGVKEQIQTIATAQATTVTYDAVYNPSYNDIVSRKSVMAEPIKSTVTWTAAYNPDYNTMIMRAGWLSEDLEPKVTWTANYNPDYNTMIMRMGWLSEDASPDINVYQHWPQGGYQGYKDRYDYLTRNQAVTITYRTAGATSIPSGLKTSAAALNATGARVVIPPITIPQPVNLVRVTVDGRELRSVVRDEIRQAMPEPAAVR